MLWMIMCIDDGDQKATRDALLGEHRQYLDEKAHLIFFSGPQQNDDATVNDGSLFILNAPSRKDAEDFIHNETFYRAGVFKEIRIRRMRKGRFYPERAD